MFNSLVTNNQEVQNFAGRTGAINIALYLHDQKSPLMSLAFHASLTSFLKSQNSAQKTFFVKKLNGINMLSRWLCTPAREQATTFGEGEKVSKVKLKLVQLIYELALNDDSVLDKELYAREYLSENDDLIQSLFDIISSTDIEVSLEGQLRQYTLQIIHRIFQHKTELKETINEVIGKHIALLSEGIDKHPNLADALNIEFEQSKKLLDSPEIPVLKNYPLTKPEDQSFQMLQSTQRKMTIPVEPEREGTLFLPMQEGTPGQFEESKQGLETLLIGTKESTDLDETIIERQYEIDMSFLPSEKQDDESIRLSQQSDSDAFGAAFMKRKTIDSPSDILDDEETSRLAQEMEFLNDTGGRKQKNPIYRASQDIAILGAGTRLQNRASVINQANTKMQLIPAVDAAHKHHGPYKYVGKPTHPDTITFYRPLLSFADGSQYEGEWDIIGQRHGKGAHLDRDGSLYEGFWSFDKKNGEGRQIDKEGNVYIGEWKDDHRHGKGKCYFVTKDEYAGDWHFGLQHGKGMYKWADGWVYKGDWFENVRQGTGVEKMGEKAFYKGEWYKNMRNGQGSSRQENGSAYVGTWKDGHPFEGKGEQFLLDGSKYKGEIKGYERNGYGVMTFKDGTVYRGNWKNDKMEGIGTLIHKDGKKMTGPWKADKFVGERVKNAKAGDKAIDKCIIF